MRCGNPLAKEGPAKMTSVAPAAPMPVDTASVVRSRYAAPLAVLGIVIAIFLLGLAASNALQARARIDDTLGASETKSYVDGGQQGAYHDAAKYSRLA